MEGILPVIKAEMLKQHRKYFHSPMVYISTFLWPVLSFLVAFYMFKPFVEGDNRLLSWAGSSRELTLFLLLGYLVFTYFNSIVISAWIFSFERFDGTLEIVFLTPANRFALLLGNALAAIVQNMWPMTCFFIGTLLWMRIPVRFPGAVLAALVLLLVTSTAWGTFMNAVFLLTRDGRILATVFEDPVEFLGGVRFPVDLFPLWLKAVSCLFPLTFALKGLRGTLLEGRGWAGLAGPALWSVLISLVLFLLAYLVVGVAEKHNKQTGGFIFF